MQFGKCRSAGHFSEEEPADLHARTPFRDRSGDKAIP
jgi:hypothetical protein